MPFNLGIGEVLVVLVVALLIFGKRLPEVGRSLGRGILEFKEGLKGAAATLNDDSPPEDEEPPLDTADTTDTTDTTDSEADEAEVKPSE